MTSLLEHVRTIVGPFQEGHYVPDWQARAARAGALSDYYTIRHRDNPLFERDDRDLGAPFGSKAILRQGLHTSFESAYRDDTIGYDFPMCELSGEERRLFSIHYGSVDSVEKMAMSAIAFALCHFNPSLRQTLLLANQFYEEGLHLHSLSTLLGIQQAKCPWIAPKREQFWSFARSSNDLLHYVLFQNCLSEGEGAVAAAEIVFALRSLDRGSPAVRVAQRIAVEETSHSLLGFLILRELDLDLTRANFDAALERYHSIEALRPLGTPKGRRQRFALGLLEMYVTTRSIAAVEEALLRAVAECRTVGTWS